MFFKLLKLFLISVLFISLISTISFAQWDSLSTIKGVWSGNKTLRGWNIEVLINENKPPTLPHPISPDSAAVDIPIDTDSLSWSCTDPDGNLDHFDVYWGTSNPPDLLITYWYSTGISLSADMAVTLGYGQTYYWRVIAYDALGDSSISPVWSFTTVNGWLKERTVALAVGAQRTDYTYMVVCSTASMANDLSDLRVFDTDNTTPLYFCPEHHTSGAAICTVWVRSNVATTDSVFFRFGYTGTIASAANCDSTFPIMYDDFNTATYAAKPASSFADLSCVNSFSFVSQAIHIDSSAANSRDRKGIRETGNVLRVTSPTDTNYRFIEVYTGIYTCPYVTDSSMIMLQSSYDGIHWTRRGCIDTTHYGEDPYMIGVGDTIFLVSEGKDRTHCALNSNEDHINMWASTDKGVTWPIYWECVLTRNSRPMYGTKNCASPTVAYDASADSFFLFAECVDSSLYTGNAGYIAVAGGRTMHTLTWLDSCKANPHIQVTGNPDSTLAIPHFVTPTKQSDGYWYLTINGTGKGCCGGNTTFNWIVYRGTHLTNLSLYRSLHYADLANYPGWLEVNGILVVDPQFYQLDNGQVNIMFADSIFVCAGGNRAKINIAQLNCIDTTAWTDSKWTPHPRTTVAANLQKKNGKCYAANGELVLSGDSATIATERSSWTIISSTLPVTSGFDLRARIQLLNWAGTNAYSAMSVGSDTLTGADGATNWHTTTSYNNWYMTLNNSAAGAPLGYDDAAGARRTYKAYTTHPINANLNNWNIWHLVSTSGGDSLVFRLGSGNFTATDTVRCTTTDATWTSGTPTYTPLALLKDVSKHIIISQGDYGTNNGGEMHIDWIRVRKYQTSDPIATVRAIQNR